MVVALKVDWDFLILILSKVIEIEIYIWQLKY